MFRSFGRNIRLVLVLFITVYIVASSFILYRTMEHRSLDMLRQLSVQYTGQQHKNTLLFMNWLEETSKLISNNQVVQNALKNQHMTGQSLRYLRAYVLPVVTFSAFTFGEKQGELTPRAMFPGCCPLQRSKKNQGWNNF